MLGWLTKDSIPERVNVCLSLPNSEDWQADFRGAILALSEVENWEEYGALTSVEMSDEWRAIFFDFINGNCSMIPVGSYFEYGGDSPPDGYFLCDGAVFNRVDFADLFAVIGTKFGVGNGTTTANLPDRRGRVGVGFDASQVEFDSLGETGGAKTHTLTIAQSASHTHTQDAHTHTQNAHTHTQDLHGHNVSPHSHTLDGGINAASGAVGRSMIAQGSGSNNTLSRDATVGLGTSVATNQNTTPTNQNTTPTNQNTGGGSAHNNLQPYLVSNYIIKY